jgi:hypothetical protein
LKVEAFHPEAVTFDVSRFLRKVAAKPGRGDINDLRKNDMICPHQISPQALLASQIV